ncbi:MAG: nucleotidyltransferase domain-containing protein [Chloroflexota bacterium]
MNAVLEHKRRTLGEFTRRLLASPVGDQIARIILYGSVARGDATQESDVDVLVLSAGPVREVDRVAGETASELWLEQGDRVEPMVYSSVEGIAVDSPFLYRVLHEGQEVYQMTADELRKLEIKALYELAQIYLGAARDRYDPNSNGSRRLTVDGAYNAVELAAKAFVRSKDSELPKTHSGVSNRFSDLFVKAGLVPRDFGGKVTDALKLRNRSRYDRNADITAEQVTETLNFGEVILKALDAYLEKQ